MSAVSRPGEPTAPVWIRRRDGRPRITRTVRAKRNRAFGTTPGRGVESNGGRGGRRFEGRTVSGRGNGGMEKDLRSARGKHGGGVRAARKQSEGIGQRRGQRARVLNTHHQLAQADGKCHDICALGGREVDDENSAARSVHQPPAGEPVDTAAQRARAAFLGSGDRRFWKTRTEGPPHFHPHLPVPDFDIGACRRQQDGKRQHGVPSIESQRKSPWRHSFSATVERSGAPGHGPRQREAAG
jgi:hypothetical protein